MDHDDTKRWSFRRRRAMGYVIIQDTISLQFPNGKKKKVSSLILMGSFPKGFSCSCSWNPYLAALHDHALFGFVGLHQVACNRKTEITCVISMLFDICLAAVDYSHWISYLKQVIAVRLRDCEAGWPCICKVCNPWTSLNFLFAKRPCKWMDLSGSLLKSI
jgi:hypothetical protein